MNPPRMEGLFDPDDWIGWWSELHPSDLFHGSQRFEVQIRYLVEDFPGRGRAFHVLSIRSEGDPLPPVVN
jgi:hypothetical protein